MLKQKGGILLKSTMPFIVMMHECSSGECLASAAFTHHVDPSGVYQPCRVVIKMHECSPGELCARAAFMHLIA